MSPIIPGCQWPLSSDQNLPLIPETKSRVVREHQQQSRDESTEETWRTSVGGALDALPNPSLQCPSVYHKRGFSKRPYNFTMLLCEVLCFTLELVEETHVVVVVAARETSTCIAVVTTRTLAKSLGLVCLPSADGLPLPARALLRAMHKMLSKRRCMFKHTRQLS